jgi:photosystem II stability/assembly factor-like uncharacterized protein
MKRYILPIAALTLVLSLISVGLLNTGIDSQTYEPRSNDLSKSGLWAGALEYRLQLLADPETGEINYDYVRRVKDGLRKYSSSKESKNIELGWISAGPDNIGGRTRAIITFEENPNKVIIGSVSGGLYESNDGGVNWQAITSFNTNVAVSALARTGDGRIYAGTGHRYDTFLGDGVFVSEDDGATWNPVPAMSPNTPLNSGDAWSEVSDLFADPIDPNKVWVCYGGGLATYTWGDSSVEDKLGPQYASAIDISDDGQTIIAVKGNEVFVSQDGGDTFIDRQSSSFGDIPSGSTGRIEVAVSPDSPNYMYAIIANPSSCLRGVFASTNGGEIWYEIAPDDNNGQNPFAPFSNSLQCQGIYDNCATVVPGQPGKLIIGGIRLYMFTLASPTPPLAGTWDLLNVNFANGPNPNYVHSDIHTFHWDSNNVFYIGCDGGIFKSFNTADTFVPANYNYRSTQYYGIAFNAKGHMAGGTQDNGTHLITGTFSTPNDGNSIRGGDGFDTELSQFNSELVFGTIYNNDVARSFDGGSTFINIADPENFPGPFHTRIGLYETLNETMATDAYEFFAQQDYQAGDVIEYTSESFGLPLSYQLPNDLATDESIFIPDPAQTLFAIGGVGQFWLTRDATKAEISAGEIEWAVISTGISGASVITCFDWSPDGDIMYIGASNGRVYRISGLRTAYNAADLQSVAASSITTIFSSGGFISDIAVDPNNPARLAISRSGYSLADKVLISDEASTTSGTTSFNAAWDIEADLSLMPVYSVLFDANNPGRVLAGTEYGVWVSDNLGDTWEEATLGMGRVPIYDLRQQTKTNADLDPLPFPAEVLNPGAIYAGTFGRGIYYIGDYILGLDDLSSAPASTGFDISIYPNPASDFANVKLNFEKNTNLVIEVIDVTGRLVYSQAFGSVSAGERIFNIPTYDFNEGNYILRVIANGQAEVGRFSVEK